MLLIYGVRLNFGVDIMINFTIILNPLSDKPLYEQIYLHICNEIKLNKLKENERLPSKKQLASHLFISTNTVETAYAMLVQEGYIRSIPRSGYYVCHIESPMFNDVNIELDEPQKPSTKYLYDFRTNAVDISSFPYSTWAKLSKTIMYNYPNLLTSGDGKGDYELRNTIAKYLHEFRGVSCSSNQIIIGAGIEYLMMILCGIIGNENIIAVENPGYAKTVNILKNSGNKIEYIPLDSDGMDIDKLSKTNANITYITPSHQFPTGTIMPIGRRTQILKWARDSKNRYIIEDDYNSEFNFIGKPIPAIQGLDSNGKVIYLSTFSRVLAPSIRIAYMVLPKDLLCIYENKFGKYASTVSRFEQQTLNMFITEGYLSRHLNRVKNIYKKQRDTLICELKKFEFEKQIIGEKAGVHILLQTDFAQKLLKLSEKVGIKIYNLDDYYFEGLNSTNTLIFGYAGLSCEEIKKAFALLRETSI